jgi:hypothetical protein
MSMWVNRNSSIFVIFILFPICLFYSTLVLFSLWEYDFSTVHSVIVLNFRNVMFRTVSLTKIFLVQISILIHSRLVTISSDWFIAFCHHLLIIKFKYQGTSHDITTCYFHFIPHMSVLFYTGFVFPLGI